MGKVRNAWRSRARGLLAWVGKLAMLGLGSALIACSDSGGDRERVPELPAPERAIIAAADLILVGEHIVTMDDATAGATAVAVQDETIVWVGNRRRLSNVPTEAQVVDLGERALLPGFIDAHGHFSFSASVVDLVNVASPPVGPVTSIAVLQAVLAEHIRKNRIPPGSWVAGMGYDDSLIAEQRHPTRQDLDAISTDHPIALMHVSAHLATGNSLALAEAGIDAETPDPRGGLVRREADGQTPNGVLEESALRPLARFMFPSDDQARRFGAAARRYASHGITTAQDGAASAGTVEQLRRVPLPIDVVVYPAVRSPLEQFHGDEGFGSYLGRVKLGGVKLILDGSPQGKTAFLSQPYEVPPAGQEAGYRGYPAMPQAMVNGMIAHHLERRVPLLVHANGDAAADMLLDAVDSAAPGYDHRTVMIHAQTVRRDQIARMKALGVIPSYFAAHTFFWGDWHRDSVLGPERARRISPAATTLSMGVLLTLHNDAPIVPPNVMRLIWASVNRLTRSGQVLGENERLTVEQALYAVTQAAAYAHFEEDLKGSLSVGKLADLVVLGRNPLAAPVTELVAIPVLVTVSRGQVVFGDW